MAYGGISIAGLPAHKHSNVAGDGGSLDSSQTYLSDLAATLENLQRTIEDMMVYGGNPP